jgi:formamidopyrimidine-DNA glycosylase
VLRDQRFISGHRALVVDEILWTAQLSSFKRADDLADEYAAVLREALIERLDGAIEHDERVGQLPIPDKLPMPLENHRRPSEACPRSARRAGRPTTRFVMCSCRPTQTGGCVLKDQRLSVAEVAGTRCPQRPRAASVWRLSPARATRFQLCLDWA